MRPLWAVYGEFGELEQLEERLPWASPFLWLYTLLSSIVLVNLLANPSLSPSHTTLTLALAP